MVSLCLTKACDYVSPLNSARVIFTKTRAHLASGHWNLSGLPTDNFLKKTLLQAFLCVNNFDIVVLRETHLTSKIDNNDLEIEGYSFERSDHPDDDARGGIGIYYKSSLPCIFKPGLTTLNESLVFQVKIVRKKCFFTCLYRNPSNENNLRDKVDEFTDELNNTSDNIKGKKPLRKPCHWIGDFNAKNIPGESISNITDLHGLHEIINQPTHFYPEKNPSCIDLIFCSQPNLISESNLLPQCHHDITYAKIDLNVKNPPL